MSNIGFEYYYLSGKNIPLHKYNLGSIRQLTLNDFIELNIDFGILAQPFVLDKSLIANQSEEIGKILQDVGDLSFLFLYEELTNNGILEALKNSIQIIYKSNEALIDKESLSITVKSGIDNNVYIINDSNFTILSDIVCEMLVIDKSEIKLEKPKKELTEIEKEFERRRKKYQNSKNKKASNKSDGFSILDIANIVIHLKGTSYDEVFNYTIYQVKNSFNLLMRKDSYMVSLLHRVSPKFDTSKDKFVHWTQESKVNKSSLSQFD